MASILRRTFSTAARTLLQFVWKGTESIPEYEDHMRSWFSNNPKLDGADRVELSGIEHTSPTDPNRHVSGRIFKMGRRLVSFHAYLNGRVVFSKASFNLAQEESFDEPGEK